MESGSALSPSPLREPADIRVRELEASYSRGLLGRAPALRSVDLDAPAGTVTALVGPNGAGKTTLFRVLLGFLTPDGGRVSVGGLPPGRHRRIRGIGHLPERATLPSGWTVDGLLRRGARLGGRRAPGPPELASLRSRYGLEGRGADRVETLSRGLSRRLTLAFALLGEPGVVLLDEPLAGLDPPGQAALEVHIRELGGGGDTVVLASHDLHAVTRVADRVVVLVDGRVEVTMDAAALASERGVRRLHTLLAAPEALR